MKSIHLFRAWMLLAVCACAVFAASGCTRGNDTPVFTSEGEFRDNLKVAESKSLTAFLKADRGEPLNEEDKANLRAAIRIFQGLYAYKPNLYTMPFAMGKAYQLLGDDAEAMNHFNVAAAILEKSTDEFAKNTLAETNYLAVDSLIRKQQFEAALAAAQRAVSMNPKSANYQAALAAACLQLGKEEEAESAVRKALELDASNRRAIGIAKLYSWGKALR